jgi:hypothetical protein
MTYSRTLTPICSLLATAVLGLAQSPAPVAAAAPSPPDAWERTPTPRAARAPRSVLAPADAIQDAPLPPTPPAPATQAMPALAPMPPMPDFELDAQMAKAAQIRQRLETDVEFQNKIELAQRMAEEYKAQFRLDAQELREKALTMAYAPQASGFGGRAAPPAPPVPAIAGRRIGNMSEDRLYSSGQSLLENRQFDQAAEYFTQAASKNGPRADGALYWKAYALGKLGKRDEALAAIAELHKSYASSRWLDDAKALELEVKQASGQTVSPESESDDELKLMAINGLMQSDPERAIPLLEKQLKGSASPKVKRNALFVLASSSSPKAQSMLEQIARGAANPDLQVKAITYMTERRRNNANANMGQVLSEIYASTTYVPVKRAILSAYVNMKDKDRLLQALKNEKTPELREVALGLLGETQGNPELWQLYQTETTPEGKIQLLRYMHSNSNPDKLIEVLKNEKDPKVRAAAMSALSSQRSSTVSADAMVSIYNAEQDPQMKQRILDSLTGQRNAKALVDIFHAEKDTKMKLRIVERLSTMKSKEATDLLQEILSK